MAPSDFQSDFQSDLESDYESNPESDYDLVTLNHYVLQDAVRRASPAPWQRLPAPWDTRQRYLSAPVEIAPEADSEASALPLRRFVSDPPQAWFCFSLFCFFLFYLSVGLWLWA